MKLKRITGVLLTLFLLVTVTACGGGKKANVEGNSTVSKSEETSSNNSLADKTNKLLDKASYHKEEIDSEKSEEEIETVEISLINNIGYDVEVGYISPAEKDAWGMVVFENIKDGSKGEAKLTLLSGSDTYDILITDTDGDSYTFYGLEIKDGYRLEFYWESNVKVEIYNKQRLLKTYIGEFASEEDLEEVRDNGEEMPYDVTGETTRGNVEFTVYNESPYDIKNVFFGPLNASIEDVDVLGSDLILSADTYNYFYSTTLPEDMWNNVEWTLFVADVDGDESLEYKVCNPYALNYVDIIWDSESGGYVLNCYYKTSL